MLEEVESPTRLATIFAFQTPALKKLSFRDIDEAPPASRVLDRQEFKIRIANTRASRQSASLLIQKMYSWRGYATSDIPSDKAHFITFSIFSDDRTVATLSLGMDGPQGLEADTLYGDSLEPLRQRGGQLCEMTKLAVDKDVKSRQVLANLFAMAYVYAHHVRGCTDTLIEVNPRHAGFYHTMLGFRQVSGEKICPRVGAPAVLLHLPLDHAEEQIRKLGGRPDLVGEEKSLYPYFFNHRDIAGITRRLQKIDGDKGIFGHANNG